MTAQTFQVPADTLHVMNYWINQWSIMWKGEVPNRIHSRDIDQGGAPDWLPEFSRWLDRGSEEDGRDDRGRLLHTRRNPDLRLRTTRAFRKLRTKNPREFEVLYRAVVKRHSLAETTDWLNERAERNGKMDRYTELEAQILLWSAVDKCLKWW